MVKMAAGVAVFCAALFLVLPSASAIQRINSIRDLRRISFHTPESQQMIVLLHWFAHTVDINNGVTYLTFNPQADYGSHHYGNYEGLLNGLPRGYTYYTVGNIHEDTRRQLPSHIHDHQNTYSNGNRARIIYRVHERNLGWQGTRQVVDQVYITQHYGRAGTEYDPQYTYEIHFDLLRRIRDFPMTGNYNSLWNLRQRYEQNIDENQLMNIQNQWQGLACLGLLLFILVQSAPINNEFYVPQYQALQSHRSEPQADTCLTCCLVLIVVVAVVVVLALLMNTNFPA